MISRPTAPPVKACIVFDSMYCKVPLTPGQSPVWAALVPAIGTCAIAGIAMAASTTARPVSVAGEGGGVNVPSGFMICFSVLVMYRCHGCMDVNGTREPEW